MRKVSFRNRVIFLRVYWTNLKKEIAKLLMQTKIDPTES